ncbi:MAG: hypothetical protein HYZ42_17415, partial [Bacteroidetes bacterium]|nr:hypothetical protein [Bacteroidota bacterium]
MKRLLWVSIILLLGSYTFGQKITKHQYWSTYTYIAKLDTTQLRYILQTNRTDSSWLVKHIVDSFYRDSVYPYKKLPFGSYVIMSAANNTVTYRTYHQHPFQLNVWGVNTTNYLTIKDDEDKVIEDAKVTLLNDSICPYAIGMGSYILPRIKTAYIIKVSRNGYDDYMMVNPAYYVPPPYKNSYPDYSHTSILAGYFVTNLPKYKMQDTVKFKAYLVDDFGNNYNERLSLWLKDSYTEKEVFIKKLKPISSGAYAGQFVLGDTLKPNQPCELILKNMVGETSKSISFTLENYELKSTSYSLQMPNQTITTGKKIMVIASAHDANQLPIMDGYIKLNIRLHSIAKVLQDRLVIPNKHYEHIYSIVKEMDPSGYTEFIIPDSIAKGFNGTFVVEASFENADHEVTLQNTSFSYIHQDVAYTAEIVKDSIQVSYYFKSAPERDSLKLVYVYQNKRTEQYIVTPFQVAIDYSAIRYEVYNSDSLVAQLNMPDMKNSVYVVGKRTCDSVFIFLQNPIKIPVHYEIYRNKKKVAEGKSVNLAYMVADASPESYYILWGHNYRGGFQSNYKTQAFHFAEKKLYIEADQPNEIYPGQQLNLKIKVTDAKKQPVEKVNITAYSVNTQIGEIPLPDVPYMGLIRNDEPLHFTTPYANYCDFTVTHPIKGFHIAALHLLDNEMYQLIFNPGGKTILNFKINKPQPEFGVYLFEKGQLQNIISLSLDNELIYHKQASFPLH